MSENHNNAPQVGFDAEITLEIIRSGADFWARAWARGFAAVAEVQAEWVRLVFSGEAPAGPAVQAANPWFTAPMQGDIFLGCRLMDDGFAESFFNAEEDERATAEVY